MAELPLYATAFLILFARVGGVLMLLPVFAEDAVPMQLRLLVALGMSLGLWGLLSPHVLPLAADTTRLPNVVITELLVGIGLGLIVRMMFDAISIAGGIISLQVGLTSAVIADPSQGGMTPVLAKFLSVAAAVVCMSLAVHHLWIASIVRSYAVFPVGQLPAAADFVQLALHTATRAMGLGVSLAAPLIVYGIVFNTALGLSARLAPAVQVFFIAQPLNLLLGIALTASIMGALLTNFAGAMAAWMQHGWK